LTLTPPLNRGEEAGYMIISRETVTLEHEADGAWRVIGYLIQ